MTRLLSSSPFPEVAESVQEELDAYRAQEDEVKRLKSIMVRGVDGAALFGFYILNLWRLQGLEGEDEGAISMLSDNTAKLTSAVRYESDVSGGDLVPLSLCGFLSARFSDWS